MSLPDPRFAKLKFDPRFRRPRRKQAKLVVDDRFKSVFSEKKEKKKSKSDQVDKYGRPLPGNHEEINLKRFYRLADGEDHPVDYARGEVLLQSSDEEGGPAEDISQYTQEEDYDDAGPQEKTFSVDPDAEIDLDETNFEDLDVQAAAYSQCHTEGEERDILAPTRRLAAINLDWDHVRAVHLFKICSSLLSSSTCEPSIRGPGSVTAGRVLNVRIYPSEFGKERMAREETEGPPPGIFKKIDDGEINVTSLYDYRDEESYDEDSLRIYQLERLRYYYAIITCDNTEAATHIYKELDGTELERSANVFDISYVPEDMTFDDEPRDQATVDPDPSFKGVEFVTEALRHSKVKLTWDEDDHERSRITRRTLTRQEIESADFMNYLASSDSDPSGAEEAPPLGGTLKKSQEPSRDRIRALLLGGSPEDLPEGWGRDDGHKDIDMEITFMPGLSDRRSEDETTLEAYHRKMKEKKKKRKERFKDRVSENTTNSPQDEFFDIEPVIDVRAAKNEHKKSKITRTTIVTQRAQVPNTLAKEDAGSLTSVSDNLGGVEHFNLKSILKAEKRASKEGKKTKNTEDHETQASFTIDVNDKRFSAVHNDPKFAIDPTNPHFKKTKGMKALLDERSQRREQEEVSASITPGQGESNMRSLIENVKRKNAATVALRAGKRKKR